MLCGTEGKPPLLLPGTQRIVGRYMNQTMLVLCRIRSELQLLSPEHSWIEKH